MTTDTILSKPSLWNIYRKESQLELLKVMRQPGFTIPSLVFPVMFYLFFGVLFRNGPDMPAYLLSTYGTFGVIGPALFSFGLGIAIERGQGWFDLKEVFPMPFSAQIISRVMVSMVFAAMIILLLFVIGAVFAGVRLELSQWLSMAAILFVGTLPFCLIGLTMGLTLKSNIAPAVVNLVYLPMAFLSGLWVPITFFPEVMQAFAMLLPPYHLSQLCLQVIGMGQGSSALLHIAVLAIYSLLFTALAHWAFNREQK